MITIDLEALDAQLCIEPHLKPTVNITRKQQ
jgi:hypothetical protein